MPKLSDTVDFFLSNRTYIDFDNDFPVPYSLTLDDHINPSIRGDHSRYTKTCAICGVDGELFRYLGDSRVKHLDLSASLFLKKLSVSHKTSPHVTRALCPSQLSPLPLPPPLCGPPSGIYTACFNLIYNRTPSPLPSLQNC